MKRRTSILILLLGLVAAFCIGAAPASAVVRFHYESSPTWLKGEQVTTNAFGFTAGKVKATTATLKSGEILGMFTASATLHPEYGGLSAFGQAAVATTTGCNYVLEPVTATVGGFGISCLEGDEVIIRITSAGCEIKIPPQIPATPVVKFAAGGLGAASDFLLSFEVAGLTYVSSGGVCGASGNNGTITGSATVKGFGTSSFTVQHGIWVE